MLFWCCLALWPWETPKYPYCLASEADNRTRKLPLRNLVGHGGGARAEWQLPWYRRKQPRCLIVDLLCPLNDNIAWDSPFYKLFCRVKHNIRLSVALAICLSVALDAPQTAQKSQQRRRWQQVSPLMWHGLLVLIWLCWRGSRPSLGKAGETSFCESHPCQKLCLVDEVNSTWKRGEEGDGWTLCMLCIISQILSSQPSTCSLKLIPGALLGLFVVYAVILFFTYYSHSAFPLFLPIWIWVHFSWLFLVKRWKGVDLFNLCGFQSLLAYNNR